MIKKYGAALGLAAAAIAAIIVAGLVMSLILGVATFVIKLAVFAGIAFLVYKGFQKIFQKSKV